MKITVTVKVSGHICEKCQEKTLNKFKAELRKHLKQQAEYLLEDASRLEEK